MQATLLTLCINLAQRLLDDETMRIQHNSRGKLLIQMRNQMRVTCFSMNLRQDFFSIAEWHSSSSSLCLSNPQTLVYNLCSVTQVGVQLNTMLHYLGLQNNFAVHHILQQPHQVVTFATIQSIKPLFKRTGSYLNGTTRMHTHAHTSHIHIHVYTHSLIQTIVRHFLVSIMNASSRTPTS